jgi:hypothetical protein
VCWNYRFIPTGHDAMITEPEELTKFFHLTDMVSLLSLARTAVTSNAAA